MSQDYLYVHVDVYVEKGKKSVIKIIMKNL